MVAYRVAAVDEPKPAMRLLQRRDEGIRLRFLRRLAQRYDEEGCAEEAEGWFPEAEELGKELQACTQDYETARAEFDAGVAA